MEGDRYMNIFIIISFDMCWEERFIKLFGDKARMWLIEFSFCLYSWEV